MTPRLAGYSGTPLVRKLGIKPGTRALLIGAPAGFEHQLVDLPDDMWTRINIEFYKDASDAVFKALVD